jgi:hypothetical protein
MASCDCPSRELHRQAPVLREKPELPSAGPSPPPRSVKTRNVLLRCSYSARNRAPIRDAGLSTALHPKFVNRLARPPEPDGLRTILCFRAQPLMRTDAFLGRPNPKPLPPSFLRKTDGVVAKDTARSSRRPPCHRCITTMRVRRMSHSSSRIRSCRKPYSAPATSSCPRGFQWRSRL